MRVVRKENGLEAWRKLVWASTRLRPGHLESRFSTPEANSTLSVTSVGCSVAGQLKGTRLRCHKILVR